MNTCHCFDTTAAIVLLHTMFQPLPHSQLVNDHCMMIKRQEAKDKTEYTSKQYVVYTTFHKSQCDLHYECQTMLWLTFNMERDGMIKGSSQAQV